MLLGMHEDSRQLPEQFPIALPDRSILKRVVQLLTLREPALSGETLRAELGGEFYE